MMKNKISIKNKITWSLVAVLVLFLFLSLTGISFAQAPKELEKMKSIQIIHPRPSFDLRVWLDKEKDTVYYPGERITIFFQVSQNSYVTIYHYDAEGRVKVLFPNRSNPNNLVRKGETQKIEGMIDPRSNPGMEIIQGFALTRAILPLEKEKELILKEFTPEVSNDYQKHLNSIKGIIINLPAASWTVSNLVTYTVKPVTPPPPPPVNYGRIVVSSNPRGAKVYLDNSYKGVTPLNMERVATGQHQIKLVLEGYQDWSSTIFLAPNQTASISADLIPLPQYGSISIYCNQGNARIYLDGVYQRTTYANQSVEIKNVKPGYHQITITKDGYQEWNSNIVVTANQTYILSAYLVPEIKYGFLAIYCNVSEAKIFLNGTYQTTSSSTQPKIISELKERQYEITLVKDGYRTWVQDVWVYAGTTTSLYVEMQKME